MIKEIETNWSIKYSIEDENNSAVGKIDLKPKFNNKIRYINIVITDGKLNGFINTSIEKPSLGLRGGLIGSDCKIKQEKLKLYYDDLFATIAYYVPINDVPKNELTEVINDILNTSCDIMAKYNKKVAAAVSNDAEDYDEE